jgi:signal transduction histidine kinase
MGEMASTLAHEMNQPLSAIANYLQGSLRLLEGLDQPHAKKVSDALDEATKLTLRAGDIIRRLREFVSRGELERRPENVNKLVEEASALALVGSRAQGVKAAFRWDTNVGPPILEAARYFDRRIVGRPGSARIARSASVGSRRQVDCGIDLWISVQFSVRCSLEFETLAR